jgi:hypothetical protein
MKNSYQAGIDELSSMQPRLATAAEGSEGTGRLMVEHVIGLRGGFFRRRGVKKL